MKNKRVKQSIIDTEFNLRFGFLKNRFKLIGWKWKYGIPIYEVADLIAWNDVSFKTCILDGVVSLTADQLRGK